MKVIAADVAARLGMQTGMEEIRKPSEIVVAKTSAKLAGVAALAAATAFGTSPSRAFGDALGAR
jgi:hypothetical protein